MQTTHYWPTDILSVVVSYLPTLDKHRTRLVSKELDRLVLSSITTYKLGHKLPPNQTLENFIDVILKYPSLTRITFSSLLESVIDEYKNRTKLDTPKTIEDVLLLFHSDTLELAEIVSKSSNYIFTLFSDTQSFVQKFPMYKHQCITSTEATIGSNVTNLLIENIPNSNGRGLTNLPKTVTTLEIKRCILSHENYCSLATAFPLERLNIESSDITPNEMKQFAQTSTLLTHLKISHCRVLDTLQSIQLFKNLKRLEILETPLRFIDIEWLCTSGIELESLVMTQDALIPDDLDFILRAQPNLKQIISLSLVDANFKTLTECCTQIEEISLLNANNRLITKQGVLALIKNAPTLQELYANVGLKLFRRYAHNPPRIVLSEIRYKLANK
jgi:hypothetical protein